MFIYEICDKYWYLEPAHAYVLWLWPLLARYPALLHLPVIYRAVSHGHCDPREDVFCILVSHRIFYFFLMYARREKCVFYFFPRVSFPQIQFSWCLTKCSIMSLIRVMWMPAIYLTSKEPLGTSVILCNHSLKLRLGRAVISFHFKVRFCCLNSHRILYQDIAATLTN